MKFTSPAKIIMPLILLTIALFAIFSSLSMSAMTARPYIRRDLECIYEIVVTPTDSKIIMGSQMQCLDGNVEACDPSLGCTKPN